MRTRLRVALKPVWLLIGALTLSAFWALWLRQHRPSQIVATEPSGASEIAWMSDETEALALATKKKWPVVIDFTADWCLPCQELDATVFHDPEVLKRMKQVVPLRLDVSNETPSDQRTLRRYEVMGLPTLIFINADGHVLQSPRITGLVPVEDFLSALDALQG